MSFKRYFICASCNKSSSKTLSHLHNHINSISRIRLCDACMTKDFLEHSSYQKWPWRALDKFRPYSICLQSLMIGVWGLEQFGVLPKTLPWWVMAMAFLGLGSTLLNWWARSQLRKLREYKDVQNSEIHTYDPLVSDDHIFGIGPSQPWPTVASTASNLFVGMGASQISADVENVVDNRFVDPKTGMLIQKVESKPVDHVKKGRILDL